MWIHSTHVWGLAWPLTERSGVILLSFESQVSAIHLML